MKSNLMIALENSRSFAGTHSVIKELCQCTHWAAEEKELLFKIAIENSQVYYVLGDIDVKEFYKSLLNDMKKFTENARKVKVSIEEEQ